MRLLLLANLFATLFMTGLIWFVQVVHYPMFRDVGDEPFGRYESIHQRLTTYVVGPVMLIEIATAVLLVKLLPPNLRNHAWAGLALVAICWIVTAVWSVPAHRTLESGFDEATLTHLVNTNWLRTIAWTARGLLMLAVANHLLKHSQTFVN